MNKLTPVSLVMAIGLLHIARASVMLAPGTVLPGQAYIDGANQYLGFMVGIRRVSPTTGFIDYATGIKIGPNQILTAAHVVDALGGSFNSPENLTILIGSNYLSPSLTLQVASYKVHPSYIQGSGLGTGSQIDLAVLYTDTIMQNPYATLGTNPIGNGTLLTIVGAGRPALWGASLEPYDGNFRSFRGTLLNPTSQFSNQYYNAISASTSSSFEIPGGGALGDSGGAGFGTDGAIYFLTTAGATSGSTIRTFGIDLTNPEVKSFVFAIPPNMQITSSGSIIQVNFSNLIPTRPYRLMSSSTLDSWEEAHRFIATGVNAVWEEAKVPEGKRFFRLEWNE